MSKGDANIGTISQYSSNRRFVVVQKISGKGRIHRNSGDGVLTEYSANFGCLNNFPCIPVPAFLFVSHYYC